MGSPNYEQTASAKNLFIARRHIEFEGKKYIVTFDDGIPKSIKVRKVYSEGKPWEHMADVTYWHWSQGLGGPKTKPRRIIETVMKRDGIKRNAAGKYRPH